VQTYILIQAVPGVDLRALARQVDRLPGVERVQVVTGPYDLIAEGRSEDPRALRLAISKLEGVLRTAAALVAGAWDREPAAT
jgi:DNA-binding Lrp family transcriptional regulator